MKNRFVTITIHVLAWILLFLVPLLSTFQVIRSLAPSLEGFSFLPMIILSLSTIGIFYLNYFFLIPKFLLTGRHIRYISTLLASILGTFLLSGLYFRLLGLNPQMLKELSPILAKISPIARANAFLMLTIAIIASISLALNNRLKQTEQEKLSAQLSSLKSQINPHFLFNTLNSIYATAIDTSPATADMVDKLSDMMRYSLKDTTLDSVPLEEEIDYIQNYIDLQKVRLDEKVKVDFVCSGDFSGLHIAPMLLISFIENAFKYGVNSEQKSNIKIRIEANQGELHLWVNNLKVPVQTDTSESGGLGIANTRNRLNLIYPSKYLLNISETKNDFTVSLHIYLK